MHEHRTVSTTSKTPLIVTWFVMSDAEHDRVPENEKFRVGQDSMTKFSRQD
jgi:hypothetical protein